MCGTFSSAFNPISPTGDDIGPQAPPVRSAATKVTHLQFIKAVDVLRKNRQTFLDARPRAKEAAKLLSDLCGFPIGKTTVPDLKEASGVSWEAKRVANGDGRLSSFNAIGTLARAVSMLYGKLGEEKPDGLVRLIEKYQRKDI